MSTPDKDIRYSVTAEDRFSRTFSQLKRDLASTQGQFKIIESAAGVAGLALGSIGVGALSAGSIGLALKRLVNDLDSLNDAADATGSSIENLSALEDVARRNGQGLETVVSAALKLNKALNEATPNSPMEQTLKRLGLSAKELRDVDPSIALQKLAQALAGFADDGDKGRLILELTGKSVKELGPLLKDLGEAGVLNAKVTTEQAQAAEKFNKELFALQTNVYNAGRSLVADLVPQINETIKKFREGREAGLGFFSILGKQQNLLLAELFGGDKDPAKQLKDAEKMLGQIDARMKAGRLTAEQQLLLDTKRAATLKEIAKAQGLLNGAGIAEDPAIARRLRGDRPSVGPPPPPKAPKTGASEAQRYLENLQKQGEKLQDLTVYQQLLADIEHKRIDGITPKLQAELKIAAQKVDLAKQLNVEKEREAGFQKLLSDKGQRDVDEVQRLLEQTTTGRLQGMEVQADKLLDFSRRIGEDDPRQRQVLEALQRIKKEAQDLAAPAQAAVSEYDKLADAIEKSMDRSTQALLDFTIEGKGSIADLGKAFARDVLRSLIEDPMRDAMKSVSKSIREAMNGGDALSGITNFFKSFGAGSGGGSGGGNILSTIGSFFGFTGRANGGDVNAGQLVRWQENGREWFVPGADGAVVNQAQMRGLGGGGSIQQTNHITIQGGGDPREVQRQIDAALARNNAALVRSMRLGGAMAG